MLKLINFTLILCLSLGCVKQPAAEQADSDPGIEFLIGNWKWRQSITSDSPYLYRKMIVKATDVSEFCTLSFSADGYLTITSQTGTTSMTLERTGILTIDDNRIVRFRNPQGEEITFSWSADLNQLNTKYNFFNFQSPPCHMGDYIKSNIYEKI